MLRIGIVDDHLLFRRSLVLLVNTFPNTKVVLQAGNGQELLAQLNAVAIDLLLLDIQMPAMDGFQTCTTIKRLYPDIKILIISQLSTREAIHKVMELGANGFFSKNSNPEQLEQAIRGIKDKEFYFEQELGAIVREIVSGTKKRQSASTDSAVAISAREMDVLRLACKEYSSIEIADRLCITARTVDTHRKRVMERTQSKNFIGVIVYALRHGLLFIDDL